MARAPQKVADVLDCLDELADENDNVSIGQVLDAFGARTYGPAIMVPALLEITPIGAIIGVPTFLAIVIIVITAQWMVGRKHPWIPRFVRNREVSASRLNKASQWLRPFSRFADRYFHRRLKFMTRMPFAQVAAALIILLCLTVPLLEVLPLAASVPMLAIAGFGLAVLMRDGVLMILALSISFGALAMGMDYWDGGLSDTEEVDGLVDQEMIDTAEENVEAASEAAAEMQDELGDAAAEASEDISAAAGDIQQGLEVVAEETSEDISEAAAIVSDAAAATFVDE
ncbi:hypothetical protein BPTFM16_02101 [Altererythrobacter insulae]|nr:hypothetical protein BPTFM16_02101 [Altererythrobacter insulae]